MNILKNAPKNIQPGKFLKGKSDGLSVVWGDGPFDVATGVAKVYYNGLGVNDKAQTLPYDSTFHPSTLIDPTSGLVKMTGNVRSDRDYGEDLDNFTFIKIYFDNGEHGVIVNIDDIPMTADVSIAAGLKSTGMYLSTGTATTSYRIIRQTDGTAFNIYNRRNSGTNSNVIQGYELYKGTDLNGVGTSGGNSIDAAYEVLSVDKEWKAELQRVNIIKEPVSPATIGLQFDAIMNTVNFIFPNSVSKSDVDELVLNRKFAFSHEYGTTSFSPYQYNRTTVISSGYHLESYTAIIENHIGALTDSGVINGQQTTLYRSAINDLRVTVNTNSIKRNETDITALKARTISETKKDVFISPAHTTNGQYVAVKLNGAGTLLVGTTQPTPAGSGAIEYAKMNIAIPIADWDKCHKVGISTSHATSVMLNLEEFIYKADLSSTVSMNQLASADGRNSARVRLFENQDTNEGRSTTTHRLEITGTVGRVYIGKVRLVNLELV